MIVYTYVRACLKLCMRLFILDKSHTQVVERALAEVWSSQSCVGHKSFEIKLECDASYDKVSKAATGSNQRPLEP